MMPTGRIYRPVGRRIKTDETQMLWLGANAQPFSFGDQDKRSAIKRSDEETLDRIRVVF